jgi:hypothetical protein
MSNEKLDHLKQLVDSLTPEQLEKIGGGDSICSASEIASIIESLQQNYDSLVDFASYVIERVAGP